MFQFIFIMILSIENKNTEGNYSPIVSLTVLAAALDIHRVTT
jgi:hypothetical protein